MILVYGDITIPSKVHPPATELERVAVIERENKDSQKEQGEKDSILAQNTSRVLKARGTPKSK